MEVKASTIYDLSVVKALLYLQVFKGNDPIKRMKTFMIISIITILICVFDLIALGNSAQVWLMLGTILLLDAFYGYIYFLLPKIQYKSAKKFADIKNEFIFNEESITITSKTDNYSGNSDVKFDIIFKVMETSKYFFVFQNKYNAYVVDKSNIVSGSENDIRRLLINHIPQKNYTICKY